MRTATHPFRAWLNRETLAALQQLKEFESSRQHRNVSMSEIVNTAIWTLSRHLLPADPERPVVCNVEDR
jgi:hypothetical protein